MVVGDAVADFLLGRVDTFPAQHLDPLAFFQVLVVLEEVSDGVAAHGVHVVDGLPVVVHGQDLGGGHRNDLAIHAGFVFHHQDTQGAASHDHTGMKGVRRDHQHVHRVTVARQRLRHIAVVRGVVHGRGHETVHEDGARFLVHFILDRVGVHRDLDDHIEGIGNVLAWGDVVERHVLYEKLIEDNPRSTTRRD